MRCATLCLLAGVVSADVFDFALSNLPKANAEAFLSAQKDFEQTLAATARHLQNSATGSGSGGMSGTKPPLATNTETEATSNTMSGTKPPLATNTVTETSSASASGSAEAGPAAACANPILKQVCKAGKMPAEAKDSGACPAVTTASLNFYCNTVCSSSCISFFETQTKSSANNQATTRFLSDSASSEYGASAAASDSYGGAQANYPSAAVDADVAVDASASAVESDESSSGNDGSSVFSDSSKLASICDGGCVPKLMRSMLAMAKAAKSCPSGRFLGDSDTGPINNEANNAESGAGAGSGLWESETTRFLSDSASGEYAAASDTVTSTSTGASGVKQETSGAAASDTVTSTSTAVAGDFTAENSMPSGSGSGSSASGNDDGAMGKVMKPLGLACQQNNNGDYCMSIISQLSTSNALSNISPNSTKNPTCAGISALVDMGCCFGSMMSATDSTPEVSEDKTKAADLAYFVVKCGGSLVPCAKGALYGSQVISSSLTIQAAGLNQEFLERPVVRAAIKKNIVAGINKKKTVVSADSVFITEITKASTRRSLTTATDFTATVKYSVVSQGEDASSADVVSAMQAVDSNSLTTSLKSDPAFAPVSSSLVAKPSTAPPTVQVTQAELPSEASTGLAAGVIAGIVIGVLAGIALAAVGVVFAIRRASSKAPVAVPAQVQSDVVAGASASDSNPGAEQL